MLKKYKQVTSLISWADKEPTYSWRCLVSYTGRQVHWNMITDIKTDTSIPILSCKHPVCGCMRVIPKGLSEWKLVREKSDMQICLKPNDSNNTSIPTFSNHIKLKPYKTQSTTTRCQNHRNKWQQVELIQVNLIIVPQSEIQLARKLQQKWLC